MPSVLTEHVRNYGPASDPTGEVLPVLERLLRYRMRQKNLLSAPPEFLGYPGVANWSDPDAFEDITCDCYLFAIAQRIAALQEQLKTKPNIDGLISRNVANFLLHRQRKQDPMGYAVFRNVRAAVKDAAAENELLLTRLQGNKLCAQSILRFGGDRSAQPAARELITTLWDKVWEREDPLPQLTQMSEAGREVVRGYLQELSAAGVKAVQWGDLIEVIAARVRSDWKARHAAPASELAWEEDEFANLVRMVWPDEELETRERWEKFKREIPERIARLDRQARVRKRLAFVFDALVRAAESGNASPPSQAELIEQTGIPRATMSDCIRELRTIMLELDARNSDS